MLHDFTNEYLFLVCLIDNRFWPPDASDKLGKIFRGRREMPGQGGEKWSNVPDRMKHCYLDELRVSLNVTMNALFVLLIIVLMCVVC